MLSGFDDLPFSAAQDAARDPEGRTRQQRERARFGDDGELRADNVPTDLPTRSAPGGVVEAEVDAAVDAAQPRLGRRLREAEVVAGGGDAFRCVPKGDVVRAEKAGEDLGPRRADRAVSADVALKSPFVNVREVVCKS